MKNSIFYSLHAIRSWTLLFLTVGQAGAVSPFWAVGLAMVVSGWKVGCKTTQIERIPPRPPSWTRIAREGSLDLLNANHSTEKYIVIHDIRLFFARRSQLGTSLFDCGTSRCCQPLLPQLFQHDCGCLFQSTDCK